jgi:hypothetical protein
MRMERQVSTEGLILAALAQMWKTKKTQNDTTNIKLQDIALRLKFDLPTITSRRVGKALRR